MTAEDYLSLVLLGTLAVYVRQILFFLRGLSMLKHGTNTTLHSITVIISARNEEKNIERCLHSLMRQTYPADKFSIIVINDQSTDETASIVRRCADGSVAPITLLESDLSSTIRSPKIRALTLGIQHSSSDIIVTTDADCTAQPEWLSVINSYFDHSVGVLTGVTVFEKDPSLSPLFHGIQFLDFLSYSAIAAGAIGRGRVLVSTGSNMAFRLQAFDEADGFTSLTHINTGDDSLLAQKIVSSGKWKARFAYDERAIIRTQPAATFLEAIHQRMRWVGQTAYYPPYMMFFMISTFIMYLLLLASIPASLIHWNAIPWIVVLGKSAADFLIMRYFTQLIHFREAMKYFLPTAFIHIPFVVFATIGGYFFTFKWKDRSLKKEAR